MEKKVFKAVVAPDSYKECLDAGAVADAMADGAREAEVEVVKLPLSDGGEGMLDIIAPAIGASIRRAEADDPLGRRIVAEYGIKDGCAVLETARVVGLSLLKKSERNPLAASTRGLGELIMDAYGKGCRKFLLGLGGSATCDGGAGMLSVPGIKEVLTEVSVGILCDVKAPFIGAEGAARAFSPQKGASREDVGILERRMEKLAVEIAAETGIDVSLMEGAGAAGGLGGALMAYGGARYTSGVDRILDIVGFEKHAEGADLIITGEGKSDFQTLQGKVPYGVLRRAGGKRVALVSGMVESEGMLRNAGFDGIVSVSEGCRSLEEAMEPERARRNIASGVKKLLTSSWPPGFLYSRNY